VTGGAGFIGGHLVRTLFPDVDVTVLDHCSSSDPSAVPDEATLVEADIRDPDAVETAMNDVDVVFPHPGDVKRTPGASRNGHERRRRRVPSGRDG